MAKARNRGGQIDNKNAEKWTEPLAIKLGEELLAWMEEEGKERDHIFYGEFLLKRDLYKEVVNRLEKRFDSFATLIKKARHIQELRLCTLGLKNKVNMAMAIFCLKNHHDYSDRQNITSDKPLTQTIIKLSNGQSIVV